MEKVIVNKTTWFITEGGENQYFGKLEAGEAYETHETVHTFETEAEWESELKRLGLIEPKNDFKSGKINKK